LISKGGYMKRFKALQIILAFMMLILGVLIAGCGSNGETGHWSPPVDTTAPMVAAVVPLNNATGVAINRKIITAAFNEAMDPATLTPASFTLECPASTFVTGTVTYVSAGNVATLTLPATPDLPPSTLCRATITTVAKDLAGNPLASNYVWTFRTGVTPDTTRPIVISTLPATTIPGPTTGVPNNTAITATFNEDMDPLTITAVSFTLTGPGTTPVTARALDPVTYVVSSRKAIFWPAAALTTGVTYTATIKGLGASPAKDVALNALAGDSTLPLMPNDYVWTFTTVAAAPAAPVSVDNTSIKPAAGAGGVCPSATISATFVVPSGLQMDDTTVSAGTNFIVTGPSPAVTTVAGTVSLDVATGLIATFRPNNPLAVGTYTVTIKGGASGVKDLAIPANTMVSDYRVPAWTFTVVPATGACVAGPNLGAASTFGISATTGLVTAISSSTVNADVLLDPIAYAKCNDTAVDAFGGIGSCAAIGFPPTINGTVISPLYTGGNNIATIKADLNNAYLSLCPAGVPSAACSLNGGIVIGSPSAGIGGLPLASCVYNINGGNCFTPGVYTAASTITITGDLTLDAQGDPNAVFIFQAGSTVGTAAGAAPPMVIAPPSGIHTRILLINGAKASNVWWVAGSSATLGLYSEFQGNILAAISVTLNNGATSCGRMMAGAWVGGGGAITLGGNNVVSVPGQPFAPPATYSATCD
jgi:hypothetical protein